MLNDHEKINTIQLYSYEEPCQALCLYCKTIVADFIAREVSARMSFLFFLLFWVTFVHFSNTLSILSVPMVLQSILHGIFHQSSKWK
jgi:hypothetical protein